MNTKYLQVKDGTLAYADNGSGPLVVCLPSIGDLRGEYRFLTPRLIEAGWRVITMDIRGHGQSSVRWPDYSVAGLGSDLLDLVASLEAGPAVVIGTSMAAGAAVWAAVENPSLFAGLVLIGPAVRGEVPWYSRLLYTLLFARPWGPGVWIKYFRSLYPAQKPDDFADYTRRLQANLSEPGRLEAMRGMIYAPKTASEERLPSVKTPAQIIMGSKDPDFKDPRTEAEWLSNALKAPYTLIDGAGHYPHAEMPEQTLPVILSFLKSLDEAREKAYVA